MHLHKWPFHSHRPTVPRGPSHLTALHISTTESIKSDLGLLQASIFTVCVSRNFETCSIAKIRIIDSSIKLSSALASAIYAGVPGSKAISNNRWSVPCNASFPLQLGFGGKPFTINERDTIVKNADGSCTGAVTGGAREIAHLGAPFMRNVYTYVPINSTRLFWSDDSFQIIWRNQIQRR